ncbi:Mediator complex, subunit Med22 [Cynara cardunculus var. scolymus]|uniref:Mediator complex, subunit Med22 n=1 Tax=Cynara cardunculus var. scolymus TaxID=59895 RepID=A0A118JY97_CYNCS|nr:Mediator complex, subunit Med22 [Cynara cardunculus var. scolymus]
MNKGGAGGGTSGAGGPTAAAAAAAAQKQKSLQQRVDNDIGSIVDNFSIVVNVARVQAADSLLKLVSELKQTAIFSGFASLNDHVEQRSEELNKQAEKTDRILGSIGEDAAASLKEMESHYYSSVVRSNQHLQQ